MRNNRLKLLFLSFTLFIFVASCGQSEPIEVSEEKSSEIPATQTSIPLQTPTLTAEEHFSLALDYYSKQLFEEAIEEFSIVIELDNEYQSVYELRGTTYAILREFDTGIEDITKAISLDPENPVLYKIRGNLYFDKGFFEDDPASSILAIEDLSKAIELFPEDAEAYYLRGQVNHEISVFRPDLPTNFVENAIEDFTKVIELEPRNALAYYYRASDYGLLGDERMIADLEMAIELGLDPEREQIARDILESILGTD